VPVDDVVSNSELAPPPASHNYFETGDLLVNFNGRFSYFRLCFSSTSFFIVVAGVE